MTTSKSDGKIVLFVYESGQQEGNEPFGIFIKGSEYRRTLYSLLSKHRPALLPLIDSLGGYFSEYKAYFRLKDYSLSTVLRKFPRNGLDGRFPIYLSSSTTPFIVSMFVLIQSKEFYARFKGMLLPIPFASLNRYPNAYRLLVDKLPVGDENDYFLGGTLIFEETSMEELLLLCGTFEIDVKKTERNRFLVTKLRGIGRWHLDRAIQIASRIEASDVNHIIALIEHISEINVENDAGYRPFCFVIGPSGSGKTMLSFVLDRFFLCIRFNMVFFYVPEATLLSSTPEIYQGAYDISKELYRALKEDTKVLPDVADLKLFTSGMKTTHFETPLRSLGLLMLVLQKTAEQQNHMNGNFGYKKLSLKDLVIWWKGVLERQALPKSVISLDEFAGKTSLFYKEEDKMLMVLARNLFCCTGIPVVIMGTDVTAVLDETQFDTAGPTVDDELPWCYVVSKLPKPTKSSILTYAECFEKFQALDPCWAGFTQYMGLTEGHDFPSFRPFVVDWAFEYIHENIDSILGGKVTPFGFFSSMVSHLKWKLFYSKHHIMHSDGIAGQFSMHLPIFRDGTNDVPAVLINCHFALLKNSDEDASDEPLSLTHLHNWIRKATFPAYDKDSLMNFILNTWKDEQAFSFGLVPNIARKLSTFSAASHYFKLFHTSDVGTFVFEHIFHVAMVVASQRGGLSGSTLSEFLPRFLQEIDASFGRCTLGTRTKKILDSFEPRIPFYPTICTDLPASLKSMDSVCSGRYDILPDSDQAEGIGQLSNGGILYLDCKNWNRKVNNADYIEIIRKSICELEKCNPSFNLHLCWVNGANISQLTAQKICTNQGEAFRDYIGHRKLIFYTVKKNRVISLDHLATILPPKRQLSGCDMFLVFPLKDLFPSQDFAFSSEPAEPMKVIILQPEW